VSPSAIFNSFGRHNMITTLPHCSFSYGRIAR
jgi:hypothetical protein